MNYNSQPTPGRLKPDLRLAESYIPAVLLTLKIVFYSFIIPLTLNIYETYRPLIFSVFLAILYVDHIYFYIHLIDTTAISVDVLFASIFMMLCVPTCFIWCLLILGLWVLTSISYILTINNKLIKHEMHRKIVHSVALVYFLLFVSLRSYGEASTIFFIEPQATLHFFARNLSYTLLVLVDVYSIRPIFQQESERYFMCKYGAVLFAPWQLGVILFGCLLVSQIMVIFQIKLLSDEETNKENQETNDVHFVSTVNEIQDPMLLDTKLKDEQIINVSELDVMEAFRIATQQYSSHHTSYKIN